MKKTVVSAAVFLTFTGALWLWEGRSGKVPIPPHLKTVKGEDKKPSDWFLMQRAYPLGRIPDDQPLKAIRQAKALRAEAALSNRLGSVVPTWMEAGPTNIPGRITDIAVDPANPNVIYAAAAAGGVFKSTDFGFNWTPIFDDEGTPSIGAVAVDPTRSNIVYVGTGESNSATDTYEGTGVYKSTDGGSTWTNVGLPNSYHIGRIVVDPLRPETVFVAVLGKLFGATNPERGLYRSTNGGASWERKLFVSDSTACVDVAFHPSTGTVFAAMWERIRDPRRRKVGGTTSGLYRSTDFGNTWSLLAGGLPAPSPTLGRIGVTVSPSSNTVYAYYCNHPGNFLGVYKSTNLGTSWVRTNDAALGGITGGFGWYFGQIRVDPANPNRVFVLGVTMYASTDGGTSWNPADFGTHVDHHALVINPSALYNGCDGGVNISTDGGASWRVCDNMPNTQFYANHIDPHNPLRLYGGTQDNGTLRALSGGTGDWENFHGGDGFYCLVDHTDSNIVFAEYQNGYLEKSTDGGLSFNFGMNGIDYNGDRHNWNTPFVMDPSDHNVLYYGSQLIYKTTDNGENWNPASPDLTDGDDLGNLIFGTVTTIDVARSNGQTVYAGTDDANVWVSKNGGGSWTQINAGLPNRWVTRVAADPNVDSVAYVTFSGYKESDHQPHIFRTTNYGQNWSSIDGNLPDAPVNDVLVDPENASTLYIGTDVGVYVTTNLGTAWAPLGTGLPVTTVHDLAFHDSARVLVAGTHGRSMFKISLACTATLGDMNADDDLTSSDVVLLLNCVFLGAGACEFCYSDLNCDGDLTSSDVVLQLGAVFLGQPLGCAP